MGMVSFFHVGPTDVWANRRYRTASICITVLLCTLVPITTQSALASISRSADVQVSPTTVRVGVYQNAPKVFHNGPEEVGGIFIEIIEVIAEQEGWTLEFIPGSWPECLERLETAEIDLLPDIALSPERAKRFSFNQIPVISDWLEVYAPTRQRIESFPDLRGKSVAILEGSIQHDVFSQMVDELGLVCEILPVSSNTAVFEAIAGDRVDAGVVNRFFGLTHKRRYRLQDTPIVFFPTSLFIAAPPERNADLLAAIDHHLEVLKENTGSVYYRLLDDWISESTGRTLSRGLLLAAGILLALLLISVTFVVLLRNQVRIATGELRQRTEELEQTLSELGRAQEEHIRKERLHALGQMASGIAHDINNALAPIIGYAELLLNDPQTLADTANATHKLETIQNAAMDAAQTVERLRAFYRSTRALTQIIPVDVNRVVHDAVDMTRPKWYGQAQSRGVRIDMQVETGQVAPVVASESELREMIVNLILNAVDALEADGTISLRTRSVNGMIEVQIEDTGIGMSEEIRETCLTPFFTTKGEAGTGMGLCMIAEVVEGAQGTMHIDSAPAEGTRITLTFPASPVVVENEEVVSTDDISAVRALKLILVDDDVRNLATLGEILKTFGHTVVSVTSAAEALQEIEQGTFDLLISDHVMPAMTGISLAEAVHELRPDMPIIVITGHDRYREETDELPPGVHALLKKPVSLSVLQQTFLDLGFAES